MMKRNKVTTWADGFGRWYARVDLAVATPSDTLPIDSVRRVARRAIRREIEARMYKGTPFPLRIEIDKTDLGADNRFYSITFREKV
jgi:hypothetical protein